MTRDTHGRIRGTDVQEDYMKNDCRQWCLVAVMLSHGETREATRGRGEGEESIWTPRDRQKGWSGWMDGGWHTRHTSRG